MFRKGRRDRQQEAIRLAFYELMLGFAWVGFSTSMIPPELDWPLDAEGVGWLKEWPDGCPDEWLDG